MGPPQTVQGAGHWYLIARHGDRVTRLRPRASLGETEAGELSFERSFAQLELDIAEDGGLVISTLGDHEIESAGGTRRHYERLVRDRGAEIRLAHNVLLLDVDFVEDPSDERAPAESKTSSRPAPRSTGDLLAQRLAAFPAGSSRTLTSVERAPVVTPTAQAPIARVPTAQPMAQLPTPKPIAQAPTAQVSPEQVPAPEVRAPQAPPRTPTLQIVAEQQAPAPIAPSLPAAPRRRRTLPPRQAALVAVAALAVMLSYLASRDGDAPESPPTVVERAERSPQAGVHASPTATEQASLPVAEHASPTASAQPAPTQAMVAAESPRVAPARDSARATRPRTEDATPLATTLPTKAPGVANATPKSEPAKSQPTAAAREQAPAPTPAPTVAAASDSKVEAGQPKALPASAIPAASSVTAEKPQLVATKTPAPSSATSAAPSRESTQRQKEETIRKALLAANQALADGRLTTPPETSAYTLFNQVLKLEPGSQDATRGLQSVREGLINRTLAELAGKSLNDARKSLQAASEMGADPMLVANLKDEIDYQQRMSGSPTENQ